jgi:hypothetical protein
MIGLLVIITASSLQQAEPRKEGKRMFNEIPAHLQLVDAAKAGRFPEFLRECATWPSEEALRRRRIAVTSDAVASAIRSTVNWCERILKRQWVPDDLERRLVPLRSEIAGHDAIRARYEVDGNLIQLVSTSSGFIVFIRPVATQDQALSQEEKSRLVIRVLNEFLNEPENIRAVSMSLVAAHPDGTLEGQPVIQRETLNYWWGLVSWWTDGRVLRFSTGKADGGSTVPSLKKDWLTRED